MRAKPVSLVSLSIFAALAFALAQGTAAKAETAQSPVPSQASAPAADIAIPYDRAGIIALAEKAADKQLALLAGGQMPPKMTGDTPNPKAWIQGVYFAGLASLAEHSDKPTYAQAVLARGAANQWQLGPRVYHADDQQIGQIYLWAAAHGAGPDVLKPMRDSFDTVLANPSNVGPALIQQKGVEGGSLCVERWCWCDAIFMAPASWFGLSKATGDPKYAAFARKEFWVTADYLYDKDEHLFYRDSRFFDKREANGNKVFWSRGDGWVFAGLARTIPLLPEGDADNARIIGVYKEMAAKLISIQKPDGYWSPGLLSDPATSVPETSGTNFYVFGLAWGVKAGILDRATYEPAIRKGWAALVRAVHPDGTVGWVQRVGDRPDDVSYDDTQLYGTGGFLLAATAVADLNLAAKSDTRQRRKP